MLDLETRDTSSLGLEGRQTGFRNTQKLLRWDWNIFNMFFIWIKCHYSIWSINSDCYSTEMGPCVAQVNHLVLLSGWGWMRSEGLVLVVVRGAYPSSLPLVPSSTSTVMWSGWLQFTLDSLVFPVWRVESYTLTLPTWRETEMEWWRREMKSVFNYRHFTIPAITGIIWN